MKSSSASSQPRNPSDALVAKVDVFKEALKCGAHAIGDPLHADGYISIRATSDLEF